MQCIGVTYVKSFQKSRRSISKMNTGLKDIDILLESNEQLNKEFLEAQRELMSIELNNILAEIEYGRINKEKIIRYILTGLL